MRRRFRTTKNTEHTERENTQDTVKAEDEITHGDRQDQEIATRGIRLRAATFGSWPSLLVSAGCVAKTHREAERCVVASSTHPTGYQLISLRALSALRRFDSPRPLSLVDPNRRTYTVATAAQIEANRRNAQKSTGPKTERGKARAKRNAITHGMTARTIIPVLPQEDPKELEDRTQEAITAMKPRNPLELDLVCRAVRLSGELDLAERVATAHLAHRVRMATRSGTDTVSAEELSKVHDLGSKLFFQAAIGPGYSDSTADDYPAVIVRRLEESAEGCRWLLARWAEILNLLDREAAWGDPEIVRFVGLLGKRGIEAHFDPELNSLFHAFDALGNRIGHKFWNERRDGLPLGYIGGFEFVTYREIAPPPSDKNAARSSSARSSSGTSAGSRSCWPSMSKSRPPRPTSGTTARRWIAARHSSGTAATSRPGTAS